MKTLKALTKQPDFSHQLQEVAMSLYNCDATQIFFTLEIMKWDSKES